MVKSRLCDHGPDGACVWCIGKHPVRLSDTICVGEVPEIAQANAVRYENQRMDNVSDIIKRVSALQGEKITGLCFPENLWHRLGQMVEQFSVKDMPPYGNFFMGFGVQTSKILPENQIVVTRGNAVVGLITIAEDGTATLRMLENDISDNPFSKGLDVKW